MVNALKSKVTKVSKCEEYNNIGKKLNYYRYEKDYLSSDGRMEAELELFIATKYCNLHQDFIFLVYIQKDLLRTLLSYVDYVLHEPIIKSNLME